MQEELLDIVDDRDHVINQMLRSEVYRQGLNNFRVINCFIENSRGELWVPKRSATKRIFPLCLDVSVGGHVESGESYLEAFMRGTIEEVRIDCTITPFEQFGYLTPADHGVSAFMTVYRIKTDSAPDYNPEDFINATWIKPNNLAKRITDGEPSKEDLIKLIQHFYM